MILQPPAARSPVRRNRSRFGPEIVVIAILLFIFIVLLLRTILAALGIEPWIVTWQVVYFLSFPLVRPFQFPAPLNTSIVRHLTYAEITATVLFGVVVLFVMASVAVRGTR